MEDVYVPNVEILATGLSTKDVSLSDNKKPIVELFIR